MHIELFLMRRFLLLLLLLSWPSHIVLPAIDLGYLSAHPTGILSWILLAMQFCVWLWLCHQLHIWCHCWLIDEFLFAVVGMPIGVHALFVLSAITLVSLSALRSEEGLEYDTEISAWITELFLMAFHGVCGIIECNAFFNECLIFLHLQIVFCCDWKWLIFCYTR